LEAAAEMKADYFRDAVLGCQGLREFQLTICPFKTPRCVALDLELKINARFANIHIQNWRLISPSATKLGVVGDRLISAK